MTRGRSGAFAAVLSLLAAPLAAQTSLTSDLWRVAAGTVVAPAPLVTGPAAPLWTAVAVLPGDARAQVGITSFHAPEEIGVTGGAVAVSVRMAGTVVSAAWGRLGIDGIARTETSPEAINGTIEVDAQVLTLGATRRLAPWLTAGAGLRVLTERLGGLSSTRGGVDAAALAVPSPHLSFGAAIRSFDPLDGGGSEAAYQVAAETRSGSFAALGDASLARLRYGVTFQDGEAATHLLTAGLVLGDALALDAGAVRESRAGFVVWRSRIGLAVRTRHYEIQFDRDGGLNGFGPTYALGLGARFR